MYIYQLLLKLATVYTKKKSKQVWKAFQPISAIKGKQNFWFNKLSKESKTIKFKKCYASAMQVLCKCLLSLTSQVLEKVRQNNICDLKKRELNSLCVHSSIEIFWNLPDNLQISTTVTTLTYTTDTCDHFYICHFDQLSDEVHKQTIPQFKPWIYT